ncbi:hypothetical protein ACU6RQ_19155 [Zobellella denitrificans]
MNRIHRRPETGFPAIGEHRSMTMETGAEASFKKRAAIRPGRSRIIELLTLGLALWLGYQTLSGLTPSPSVTQPATTIPAEHLALPTPVRKPVASRPENRAAVYEESPEATLDQLTLWQYHQGSTLTGLDITTIQQDLTQLAQLGPQAIPAIYQYLSSGQDIDFEALGNGRHLGHESLRLALFEVLHRIGGNEAEAIWFNTLNNTRIPREIAALGQYLEEWAPGHYQADIVAAARDAFQLATDNGVEGHDTGPLFQVFQKYGNADLIPELEQVSQLRWGQYAAVALAGLPEGQGIPSLVRLVQGASPNNLSARFALQVLAQESDHPEAQVALVNSLHNQQIPDYLWPDLAGLLAGTYRIQIQTPLSTTTATAGIRSTVTMTFQNPGGGQQLHGIRYYRSTLSESQLWPRIRLIETLYQETTNPKAKRALEQAYNILWSTLDSQE